ncbi:MAG TPA: DUF924 family protein [Oxalicibacterium sp.]|uniref:DUF924 family protein n=1 Tax=Oxalicibacterium sp. TaxID=2766525 RepID=UPI002B6E980A|nr:DUF924 family protein [Oxalicibacterium sp.]HWU97240.1 DUF924 family protein [Oxalicibacterium sp.]
MTETAETIRTFWFGDDADDAAVAAQQSKLWWAKNDAADIEIRTRFQTSTLAAAKGALDTWAATPSGTLALILLTDQFPRNMYRGRPESFSFDPIALHWTLHALEHGFDASLRPIERIFIYLPLEHAESLMLQQRAVQLYEKLLSNVPTEQQSVFSGFVNFAVRHRDVIARFGRFPHRNAILGRASTQEEIAFLKTAGSSF